MGIFAYLGMAQKPIESMNITPAANADKWRFTLADGTEVLPDESGSFVLPEDNAELFCTVSLDEYADRLTTSALLFLVQVYHKKGNPDVLLLALVSLSFCLLETVTFGIYVVWFLKTPFVTYTLRLLPTLMLLWILWYRCRGKIHRFGWLYPILWTLAAVAGIVWRQLDIVSGNQFTNLLQGKLLPLAMLIALLVCGWQAIRGNDAYRRFFALGGVLAVFFGLVAAVSVLAGGEWWNTLQNAFRNTALLGWFEPLQLLNKFLLILLFIAAFYDFVQQIVRRNAEMQTLALQNRYANEHAEHLRRSLDETRTMRHEMRHHIDALQGMIAGGDMPRAAEYIRSLYGDFCTEPTRYTDHPLINTLVSSCAQKAKALGADFQASVQVPEKIGIEDTDLAVLLTNMTDNALEALSEVPDKKDRRFQLTAAIFENTGLFVSCTNTFSGERKYDDDGNLLSTKTEGHHGLGLKAMHQVAEKYNNILLSEIEENSFHVKTYLYFKK